jgi:hypothetical protein
MTEPRCRFEARNGNHLSKLVSGQKQEIRNLR